MSKSPFGWGYPAGAEHDPNAPWNQPDAEEEKCDECGNLFLVEELNEDNLCAECLEDIEYG